jgi:hypothetical protein
VEKEFAVGLLGTQRWSATIVNLQLSVSFVAVPALIRHELGNFTVLLP